MTKNATKTIKLLSAAAAIWSLSPLAAAAPVDAPVAQSASINATEQPTIVTVSVGLSTVHKAPWPVKRVSVTDPKIADVQVVTPNQILISGKVVGATDLIMWNQNEEVWRGRIEVEVDRVAIKTELAHLFPKAKLEMRQAKDVLIINGTLEQAEDAQDLRRFMDATGLKYVDMTKVAGLQQVQIKVTVAEASRVALRLLGINAGYTDGKSFGFSNQDLNQFSLQPVTGALSRPFDGAPSQAITLFGRALVGNTTLEAFVAAMADNQYMRVMAEPNLVALSGQEASFLAGGEFPIPVPQNAGSGTGGTTITITYKEFGVRLKFRPTVLGNGAIRLHVAPEVSELTSGPGALQIQGFNIPALNTRRAETTLELNSGQTFAMAGLLNQSVQARNQRVPGLGDMPIVGSLFRSVRYQSGETELLVLVTASLVEPTSASTQAPLPGSLHVEPNDWELYGLGRIEGKAAAKVSAVDAQEVRKSGLDRLKGPGAWETFDTPAASSTAALSGPASSPDNTHLSHE